MDTNTNQEFFTRTVQHLRKQEQPAARPESYACMYRVVTQDGVLTCAVGCHIPEELYDPDMDEAGDVFALMRHFGHVLAETLLKTTDISLAKDMQNVHDDQDPDVWEERFQEVAHNWELQVPEKEVA